MRCECSTVPTEQSGSRRTSRHLPVTIQNLSNATNEWQDVTGYGAFGPTHLLDRFDRAVDLPRGWTLHTTSDGDSGGWHTSPTTLLALLVALGIEGCASIGSYRPDAHTHLIGPEIMIPENATARLRFQHWICLRPHGWRSGGGLHRGATWSHFGDGISGLGRPFLGQSSVPILRESDLGWFRPMGGCGGLGGSNRRSVSVWGDVDSAEIHLLLGCIRRGPRMVHR